MHNSKRRNTAWNEWTLHVVVVRPDLIVSGLQLLLEGLVFVGLCLSLLHRCYHPAGRSLCGVVLAANQCTIHTYTVDEEREARARRETFN